MHKFRTAKITLFAEMTKKFGIFVPRTEVTE